MYMGPHLHSQFYLHYLCRSLNQASVLCAVGCLLVLDPALLTPRPCASNRQPPLGAVPSTPSVLSSSSAEISESITIRHRPSLTWKIQTSLASHRHLLCCSSHREEWRGGRSGCVAGTFLPGLTKSSTLQV